ncbi:MAG: DUF3575 domain-containing protein [Ekhidna sp.]|nr:DUF3575 domain-containing protein [Ekhidna sp.]
MKSISFTILLTISSITLAQTIDTNYDENKKRAIKFEFFSPLTGNSTIGYEKYVKDWISWEVKVGVIGLGIDPEELNPAGILVKGGPKFKLNPDFVTSDLRGSHLLGGKYIRPEIVFAQYSEDDMENFLGGERERREYTSFAFLITYGRQYILANVMTLDYHIGLGYGWVSSKESKYNYGFSNGGTDFPVAISAGLTIGFLLK